MMFESQNPLREINAQLANIGRKPITEVELEAIYNKLIQKHKKVKKKIIQITSLLLRPF
ncbi:MAG: hypothetical protein WCI04_01005 [archaeon]